MVSCDGPSRQRRAKPECGGWLDLCVAFVTMPAPTIDEITLADEPERWAALGFVVAGGVCQLADVRMRFAGEQAGRGIVSWSLRDVNSTELDGLPTTLSTRPLPAETAPEHPNGVVAIDHVVAMSPAFERSV